MSSSSTGATAGTGTDRAAPHDLVEQLLEPLGQHRDLHLLQRDAIDRPPAAGLQVERAVAGLAHGAGDEPLGRVEDEAPGVARDRPYVAYAGSAAAPRRRSP